jgi:hypothetical protein
MYAHVYKFEKTISQQYTALAIEHIVWNIQQCVHKNWSIETISWTLNRRQCTFATVTMLKTRTITTTPPEFHVDAQCTA